MTPEDEKKIEKWGQHLENDVHIKLILTKDKRSDAFRHFIDRLTRISPKIRTSIEKEDEPTAPEIRIGNIRYRAIPLNKELDPFLRVAALVLIWWIAL